MQVNDKSRDEFYQMLKEANLRYGRSVLEAYAPVNDYARRALARDRATDISVESGNAEYETTCAQGWENAAAVTDTIGDVVTLGAHRNLEKAYDCAAEGKRWEAAKQVMTGGAKVGASAVLAAPGKALGMVRGGLAARGMAEGAQGIKLANWPGCQRVVAGLSDSRVVRGARALAGYGMEQWKNAKTFLTSASEAFSKSKWARPARAAGAVARDCKNAHEAQETVEKWESTLAKNLGQFHPKQAFRALQKELQQHAAQLGAGLNHRV